MQWGAAGTQDCRRLGAHARAQGHVGGTGIVVSLTVILYFVELRYVMQAVGKCLLGQEAVAALLQHSWGVLDAPSKNMFLDVATLLRHRPYDEVEAVWIGWHGMGALLSFRELERHCLVELKEGSWPNSWNKKEMRLEMHDLLAELGRAKVLDPKNLEHGGSRLWVEGGKVMGCEQVWSRCFWVRGTGVHWCLVAGCGQGREGALRSAGRG
jgi:hypothetical protein